MKRWTSGILAILLVIGLAGCTQGKAVQADVTEIADGLKNTVVFQDEMTVLDDDLFARLYTVESTDVAAKRIYTSTRATAEEIAAFEAVDEAAAARIKTALEARIEKQKEDYVDYAPAEMPKLNDPVLVVKGKYVVLCVSDENDKARAEIERHWK